MEYYEKRDPPSNGNIPSKTDFLRAQNRVALLMFIMLFIYFAANILLAVMVIVFPQIQQDNFRLELSSALLYLSYTVIPIFTFPLISGVKVRSYVSIGRGKKRTFLYGAAALGVVYFAQLVTVLLSELFDRFGVSVSAGLEPGETDVKLFILRIVYLCVFPAIFEELLTRGLVLGELLPYGKGFAIIASGALFGLMHMNPLQIPFAFIAGTVMAYTVVSCGTVRVSVAVHFINNFLSVLFISLPSFLPESASFIIEAAVSAVIFAAGAVSAVYLIRHKEEEDRTERTALSVNVGEERKTDIRNFSHKCVSPALYAYSAAALSVAILLLFIGG